LPTGGCGRACWRQCVTTWSQLMASHSVDSLCGRVSACCNSHLRANLPFILTAHEAEGREQDADQAADDGAVQADELQIGADAVLDLRDERVRLERLEVLPHGDADLMVVALQQ